MIENKNIQQLLNHFMDEFKKEPSVGFKVQWDADEAERMDGEKDGSLNGNIQLELKFRITIEASDYNDSYKEAENRFRQRMINILKGEKE